MDSSRFEAVFSVALLSNALFIGALPEYLMSGLSTKLQDGRAYTKLPLDPNPKPLNPEPNLAPSFRSVVPSVARIQG